MRDVVGAADVEPMNGVALIGAAHAAGGERLRRLRRNAEDDRNRAAERGLDGVFVADAVLQRDDRRSPD